MPVVLGLLAMHGLGPVPVPPVTHAAHGQPAVAAPAGDHEPSEPSGPCGHDSGPDGHLSHADDTCAAGGTGKAPALPALRPVAMPGAGEFQQGPQRAPGALGARPPPSLSQLQLLRI